MVSIGYVVVCKRYIITGKKKGKGDMVTSSMELIVKKLSNLKII